MFICKREFRMRDAKAQKDQDPDVAFIPSPCRLNNNSANLELINNFSGESVPMRLLAIDELIECNVEKCEYNAPDYNAAICRIVCNQFAHLYVFSESGSKYIEHCIVAFMEGKEIGNYSKITEILYETVKWLKIEDKRPHFFIFYLQPPAIQLELDTARLNITQLLRKRISNYQEGEAFCQTSNVIRKAKNCIILTKSPYRFKIA